MFQACDRRPAHRTRPIGRPFEALVGPVLVIGPGRTWVVCGPEYHVAAPSDGTGLRPIVHPFCGVAFIPAGARYGSGAIVSADAGGAQGAGSRADLPATPGMTHAGLGSGQAARGSVVRILVFPGIPIFRGKGWGVGIELGGGRRLVAGRPFLIVVVATTPDEQRCQPKGRHPEQGLAEEGSTREQRQVLIGSGSRVLMVLVGNHIGNPFRSGLDGLAGRASLGALAVERGEWETSAPCHALR